MFGWRKKKHENNYIKSLLNIPDHPPEWHPCVEIAVGGLTEIGFSQRYNHLLLVISDFEEYGDWYDPINLTCNGIGPLAGEKISIAGQCGGGLPMYNHYGETLERVSPSWDGDFIISATSSDITLCYRKA
ncbi:hypothetical protein [Erwinia sp. MYb535]|uniref:hypothetical protein n=1 Tax=Erwinia sp. MYb535 TaxID=2745309 RepID=UPI0030974C43